MKIGAIKIGAVSLFLSAACAAGPSITSGLTAHYDLDGGVTNALLGGQSTYIGPLNTEAIALPINAADLSGTEGTIMFWVRPHYAFHDSAVHTYLFAAMDVTGQAEFVVADGWWPDSGAANWWDDGSNWLYFIHRDASGGAPHVRTTDINIPVERDRGSPSNNLWKFMAVTWKQSATGEMNFYVNGRLPPNEGGMRRTAVTSLADFTTVAGNKTLYLGNRPELGRGADAEFDELSVYNRALSASEIQQVYEDYLPTSWQRERDEKWMEPEVSNVYAPTQDGNGVALENRVLFDENALFLVRGVSDVIDTIKDANMNVYVPNIWHGRGARWKLVPSSAAAEDGYDATVKCFYATPCASADVAGAYASADPFADLITQAHANGIEVHPWFTVFLHQWPSAGSAIKHRDALHSGWTYQYVSGVATVTAYDPASRGSGSYVEYITAKIVDVVTRYDIDGINLDFVRYQYDLYPQSNAVAIAQRKLDVAAAIGDIVTAVRAVKPDLVISIDGHVASEFDHRLAKMNDTLGRNQTEWLKAGLIDVAFDMDYAPTLNIPKFEHARGYVAPEKTPHNIVKLLGNYENPTPSTIASRDSGLVAKLARFSQNRWPGTVALYWMDEFYRDPGQVTALASGPFQRPARTLWKFDGPRVTAKQVSTGTLLESRAVEFEAEAIHIEEGDLSGDIEWFLVRPSPAAPLKIGEGATLSHLFTSGTHEIFARATDSLNRSSDSKTLTIEVDPVSHGLTGVYYNGTSHGGSAVLTRIDANVDYDWQFSSPGSGVNSDYFSVRWTGRLIVPSYTGTYEFCMKGDDGVRLWVDNTQLLDFWVLQDSFTNCADIALTAGQSVPIRVEFFDAEEEAIVQMKWSYSGQAEQVVPTSALYVE